MNPLVIKAVAVAATDKRTWKVVAVITAAVLTPFILVLMFYMAYVGEAEAREMAAATAVTTKEIVEVREEIE